jgi:prepilin-type N-terminal cleavage/methylation domain-containing protein
VIRRPGFSLIEVMVALALVAVAIGLTFMNLRQPIERASTRVVAEQVGEFLRRTRNRAQKEERPIAVVLPNSGGSAATCQSVAELDGPTHPIITRVKDFSTEHPKTVIFIGTYPTSGSWSIDPAAAGNSAYFATGPGGLASEAPINDWVNGNVNNVLTFLPDGTVLGNDLPHLNGTYKIVVSQGVTTGAGNAGGNGIMVAKPTVYGLLGASEPYTVSVSSTGIVEVNKGVDLADSGVTISQNPLALGSPAPALPAGNQTVVNPKILDLIAAPNGGLFVGLFGLEQILHPTRQLTFTAVAEQSNDEELFCEFVMSKGTGQFSSSGKQKMYYQPGIPPFFPAAWRGTTQWAPPPNSAPGTVFAVDVIVTSARGGSDTTVGNATLSKDITTYDEGQIFFGATSALTGLDEVYSVRGDGTDLKKVTFQELPDTAQSTPAGARDGHKLLYTQVDLKTTQSSIYAQSRRGGLTTRITAAGIYPSLSDDTTVMTYQWTGGLFSGLPPRPFTVNPDLPAWPPVVLPVFDPADPNFVPGADAAMRPSVSPPIPFGVGGTPPTYTADPKNRRVRMPRRIAFEGYFGLASAGNKAIYTADFYDPGQSIPITNLVRQTQGAPQTGLLGGDSRPVWHPDGTKILFESNRTGGYQIYVVPFNDNPAAQVSEASDGAIPLTPGFTNARDAFYSPDGRKLVFASDDHSKGNWDLYLLQLDPGTGYLTAKGTPYRMGLGNYSLFQKTFTEINGPVWTL